MAGFGISYFGTGLILPVNAIYLSEVRGFPSATVAAFFLLLPVAGLIGGFSAGRSVDRIGSRSVGVIGFVLQSTGWILVPFAPGSAGVGAAAVLAGLGAGVAAAALRSQLALVVPSKQRSRAFAVRNVVTNLGAAAGACVVAALAALATEVPYRTLYVLDALSYLVFGVVMWRVTRQAAILRKTFDVSRASVLRRPGVVAGLLGHLLVFAFGLASFESALPLLLRDLLYQPLTLVSIALAVSTIVAVVAQLPIERALRRFPVRAKFAWHTGCWMVAWLLGVTAGATSGGLRSALVLGMMLAFSAGACVYEAVFQPHFADIVPAGQIGRANGLLSVAYNLGTILGSSGLVYLVTRLTAAWQMFAVLAFGAIASAVALFKFAAAPLVPAESR
nr:MFS transporter [uncultured Actinoplanes sp.]